MAGDWRIGFAGEIVMPWVVGSGQQTRIGVDSNRAGVFARGRWLGRLEAPAVAVEVRKNWII